MTSIAIVEQRTRTFVFLINQQIDTNTLIQSLIISKLIIRTTTIIFDKLKWIIGFLMPWVILCIRKFWLILILFVLIWFFSADFTWLLIYVIFSFFLICTYGYNSPVSSIFSLLLFISTFQCYFIYYIYIVYTLTWNLTQTYNE